MKRSYVFMLIAIVMVTLPGVAFAQGTFYPSLIEYNTLGGGARAAGMGGAFLGLAEGEYAYSWNPAGMMFAEKPSIGIQFVSGADKFTTPYAVEFDSASGIITVHQIDIKREHFNLDFGGFAVPFAFFERQWAVGGGYRNVFDMELEFEAPGPFGSKDVFTQTDGVDAISFSLAGKVIEGVALGVTANSYIRGTETNYFMGKRFERSYPDNDRIDTLDLWINDNSHYSGFNLDIGLGAEFSMFKGGFVIHTPYDLIQHAKLTENVMVPPTPIGTIDRITYTTNMPLAFSLGVAVTPVEKLTLAVDYDSRPMSKAEIDVNFESSLYADFKDDPNWEDVNQFRIGAEYVIDGGFANIPLRAGFRNNPSVAQKFPTYENGELVPSDQITTNLMTFGTGLQFDKAWIDLAYQFGSMSYTRSYDILPGAEFNEKLDYSRLFFSAGMNF